MGPHEHITVLLRRLEANAGAQSALMHAVHLELRILTVALRRQLRTSTRAWQGGELGLETQDGTPTVG
jgi:hypothetical protein